MLVLGISGGLTHDASACLVRDNKIIAMAEEERFVRIKRVKHVPPIRSTLFCLTMAGVPLDEVDIIAVSWVPEKDKSFAYMSSAVEDFISHPVFGSVTQFPQIQYVDHHRSHASAAYRCSGFPEASIVILDARGEDVSTSLGYAKGPLISFSDQYPVSQSLGLFYKAAAQYLGLGTSGEGKLMGLAAYGDAIYPIDPIRLTEGGYYISANSDENLPPTDMEFATTKFWEYWFHDNFGSQVVPYVFDQARTTLSYDIGANTRNATIAASVQATLESVVCHLVKTLVSRTGSRNLVIGGGVGLNCGVNSLVLRSGLIDNLYVFPASHDGGASLGAALEVLSQHDPTLRFPSVDSVDLGPSYTAADIHTTLKEIGVAFKEVSDISRFGAEELARYRTVGWFQGRMEVGPRALGHRSILANPTKPDARGQVNVIKHREPWRPLAPSVMSDYAPAIVNDPMDSPFMLLFSKVTDSFNEKAPAVVHVDGTTRHQTVSRTTNRTYWDLINAYYGVSSVPAVLNTSFNLAGEPIVCSPVDALRTFYSSQLDTMILEHFVITKEPVRR